MTSTRSPYLSGLSSQRQKTQPIRSALSRLPPPGTGTVELKVTRTWTRDVLFDRPGMVRMVVRCCSISMRTSDHWLNASEILLALELSKATRNRYLPENYLVLLPDDVFELLDTGDGKIAYKPTARYVNAAHLGKLYNMDPHKLSQFFSDHQHIDKQVKRGNPGHLQGTYISFDDARLLCAHFNMSYHPIERLIELLYTPVAGAPNSAPSAPATLSAPDPPGASETAKEAVYDAQTSYITEPNYANGSYLVPAAGSRLTPRNLQSCLAPSGTPYDPGREFESERRGHCSWPPGLDIA
ncbi:hypothetical protein B0T18DRAFT_389153 [Schizothecium vesticola]|uniref:HTH APSES-type domain-containing protein n=1 Tax=Schizothecium vesticola TaxID=314040 RepID=A0AA40K867_9PEZI|nr:hypothetical protein B0T18DRAFT_389153 [Schizothecium vesticola]